MIFCPHFKTRHKLECTGSYHYWESNSKLEYFIVSTKISIYDNKLPTFVVDEQFNMSRYSVVAVIFLSGKTSIVWVGQLSWYSIGPKSQVQYWLGFNTLVQQGIFLPEQTFSCCLHSPTCNRMHQHLFTSWNLQTLAAIPMSGHVKILHAQMAMGSAALAAAAALPGWSRTSCTHF